MLPGDRERDSFSAATFTCQRYNKITRIIVHISSIFQDIDCHDTCSGIDRNSVCERRRTILSEFNCYCTQSSSKCPIRIERRCTSSNKVVSGIDVCYRERVGLAVSYNNDIEIERIILHWIGGGTINSDGVSCCVRIVVRKHTHSP